MRALKKLQFSQGAKSVDFVLNWGTLPSGVTTIDEWNSYLGVDFKSVSISGNTTTFKINPLVARQVGTIFWGDEDLVGNLDMGVFSGLTRLYCNNTSITSLDVSTNTALIDLYCNDTSITSLDVSTNTALTSLYCYTTQMTPTATDNVIIDIEAHTVNNGNLQINNNRTSATDDEVASLIARSWSINEI